MRPQILEVSYLLLTLANQFDVSKHTLRVYIVLEISNINVFLRDGILFGLHPCELTFSSQLKIQVWYWLVARRLSIFGFKSQHVCWLTGFGVVWWQIIELSFSAVWCQSLQKVVNVLLQSDCFPHPVFEENHIWMKVLQMHTVYRVFITPEWTGKVKHLSVPVYSRLFNHF